MSQKPLPLPGSVTEVTWKSDGQLAGRTGDGAVVGGADGSCEAERLGAGQLGGHR